MVSPRMRNPDHGLVSEEQAVEEAEEIILPDHLYEERQMEAMEEEPQPRIRTKSSGAIPSVPGVMTRARTRLQSNPPADGTVAAEIGETVAATVSGMALKLCLCRDPEMEEDFTHPITPGFEQGRRGSADQRAI